MTDEQTTMPVVKYSVTDAALAVLTEKYKNPNATTAEGYALCKEGVKELTALRTGLETERKKLKAPALEYGTKLDAEARKIKARIEAIEGPVRAAKEAIDEVERLKALEAAQAEQARKDAIQSKIDSMAPDINPSKTAADYTMAMSWLNQAVLDESIYEEFTDQALQARDAALHKLRQARDAAQAQEDADKARAAENERLAAERAEQKKRQDDLDAQERVLQAGRDAVDAEKKRIAADAQKVIDDAAAAEQKAIDDKAAEAAAEQRRKDDIAEAERKVDEQRIADEAETKRQKDLLPDKERLNIFADELEFGLNDIYPDCQNEDAKGIENGARATLAVLAGEIRADAEKL